MSAFKLSAVIAAATLGVAGCQHAKHVDRGEEADDKAQAEAQPKKPQTQARSAPRTKPGHPPVASTPEGLFKPGAAEKIQAALERRGHLGKGHRSPTLDDATVAALKGFQGKENIAQTGMPDHETIERLGLEAQEIYRVNPTGEKKADEEAEKRGE